ncbi:MAG: hypothetical protein IKL32_01270 [Alphaproteobacteria bacterium]|nr:hypothetical protein [Alphaproteobacteria bacterium]
MNNENLRSEIQARFKRVDNDLSRNRKINKGIMIGSSAVALLYALDIANMGLNASNGFCFMGFSALAMTAVFAQKSIPMGRKNLELRKILNMCDKRTPANFYANCDTGQKVIKIMECAFFLGAVAWLVGKLPTPNFNFLMGAVSCAGMSYEYHLTKKNRKILSAEFPRGVIDEHTR